METKRFKVTMIVNLTSDDDLDFIARAVEMNLRKGESLVDYDAKEVSDYYQLSWEEETEE